METTTKVMLTRRSLAYGQIAERWQNEHHKFAHGNVYEIHGLGDFEWAGWYENHNEQVYHMFTHFNSDQSIVWHASGIECTERSERNGETTYVLTFTEGR